MWGGERSCCRGCHLLMRTSFLVTGGPQGLFKNWEAQYSVHSLLPCSAASTPHPTSTLLSPQDLKSCIHVFGGNQGKGVLVGHGEQWTEATKKNCCGHFKCKERKPLGSHGNLGGDTGWGRGECILHESPNLWLLAEILTFFET